MQERTVYILLTDTGTFFTKMIKFFTKQPLNHASIAFDPQLRAVYSFGRKQQLNPFVGGFVDEDVRSGLFLEAKCALYSCSFTEEQYQLMVSKVKEIEEEKEDYKYNFLGLFAVLFNKKMDRDKAYFCSQFVATILNESGKDLHFNKPLSLVTPHDLHKLSSFQLEFQGKLSSLLHLKNEDQNVSRKIFSMEVA